MELILRNIKDEKHIIIIETKHFIEKTERKYCGYNWVYGLLKTEIPLKIEYQDFNKFKLIYKHPENFKYNLIIVIFIENMGKIRIITTFPESSG